MGVVACVAGYTLGFEIVRTAANKRTTTGKLLFAIIVGLTNSPAG